MKSSWNKDYYFPYTELCTTQCRRHVSNVDPGGPVSCTVKHQFRLTSKSHTGALFDVRMFQTRILQFVSEPISKIGC